MTNRQCCGKYQDQKQRNRMHYARDWVRCRNNASITIYGSMPRDNDRLPWVAFVCKKHAETANVQWVEFSSIEDVAALLASSELDEYLGLFFKFHSTCLTQIQNWRESQKARLSQREALIRLMAESAEEVRQVLRGALKKYKKEQEAAANA